MNWWERISEDALRQHLESIKKIGFNSETGGYTRPSYSLEEQAVLNYFAEQGDKLGCDIESDKAGNLFIIRRGEARKRIIIGSHCDSVANGGNYDGTAGVAIGLVVLEAMEDAGVSHSLDICVMGIRAEESQWFGSTYIGSKAALGVLDPSALKQTRKDGTITLEECLLNLGDDTRFIADGTPTISKSDIEMYIEAHIEQGPVLLGKDLPIGIVTAIAGSRRHNAMEFIGEDDHSGTTPPEAARSAVAAFNTVGYLTENLHIRFLGEGAHLRLNFGGRVHTRSQSNGIKTIPGYLQTSLDIRGADLAIMERFYSIFMKIAQKECDNRNILLKPGPLIRTDPVEMDKDVIGALGKAAYELDIPSQVMPSGAGHDASVFAQHGIPTGMVFLRHNGKSHSPKEDFDYAAGACGARVIAKLIDTYS